MKLAKKLVVITCFAMLGTACRSQEVKTSVRLPSGAPVSSLDLGQVSPLAVLESLKANCCQGVMVEKTVVSFWGEAEIAQLQKYVDDHSPASPVYRATSPVICTGPQFVSTVGREARHLIAAIKKGIYPLAQCSTYDLRF